MEVTCDVELLIDSIVNQWDAKSFRKYLGNKEFPGGVQIRIYNKYTMKQQAKLWRDIGKAADQVLWTPSKMYAVLQTSVATAHLFQEVNDIPWTNGRTKQVTSSKTFSAWSKQDVIDGMDIILEFMEYLIQDFHQEEIFFHWSSKENQEDNVQMFEFTGRPYHAT